MAMIKKLQALFDERTFMFVAPTALRLFPSIRHAWTSSQECTTPSVKSGTMNEWLFTSSLIRLVGALPALSAVALLDDAFLLPDVGRRASALPSSLWWCLVVRRR